MASALVRGDQELVKKEAIAPCTRSQSTCCDPPSGFTTQPILMNLASWNRLSNAEKRIIADEARQVELSWPKASGKLIAEEEKALVAKGIHLVAKGIQIARMGEAQKAKLKAS